MRAFTCLLSAAISLLLASSCAKHASMQAAPDDRQSIAQFTSGDSDERSGDWSPDGKWIAFESHRSGNADIWIQPVSSGKKIPGGEAIQVTDDEAADGMVSWSPVGDRLLFVSQRTGGRTIWTVDPFDTTEPPAQVTTDADELTGSVVNWSHDGREIVFSSGRTGSWDLFAVSAVGGEVRQITDRPDNDWDPDWSADGEWIAFNASPRGAGGDLWIVPAAGGGQARQLTSGAHGDYNPAWSPDGKWIAFCSPREGDWDIWIVPSAGGTPRNVTEGRFRAFRPRWSPDGRSLLFPASAAGKGELWSQPSDGGEPVKIASDVEVGIGGGGSWSPDGSEVAFVKVTSSGGKDIWKVNDAGEEVALTQGGLAVGGAASVRWSPSGELIAFVSQSGGGKRVWTVPAQGGEPSPIATPGEVTFASWSPDGRRLAIAASREDSSDIWIVPVDGVEAGLLLSGSGINTQPDWSPDGREIAFASNRPRDGETEPSWNIWRVAASGGETSYLMEGHSPQWSRDGLDVLHVWDGDVWTAPAAGGVPVTLVAINHDESRPRWSQDGSKILYSARQGHSQTDIWIADVGRVVDGIDSP